MLAGGWRCRCCSSRSSPIWAARGSCCRPRASCCLAGLRWRFVLALLACSSCRLRAGPSAPGLPARADHNLFLAGEDPLGRVTRSGRARSPSARGSSSARVTCRARRASSVSSRRATPTSPLGPGRGVRLPRRRRGARALPLHRRAASGWRAAPATARRFCWWSGSWPYSRFTSSTTPRWRRPGTDHRHPPAVPQLRRLVHPLELPRHRPHSRRRLPAVGEPLIKKTLLIERDPHQTRVAVLENDRLAEVVLERHRQRGLVGNLYKGRVTRVLPGMQAAFVDCGLERDAFLYVSDAVSDDEASMDGRSDRDAVAPGGQTTTTTATTRKWRPVAPRSSTCSSRDRRSWSRCARTSSPAKARG